MTTQSGGIKRRYAERREKENTARIPIRSDSYYQQLLNIAGCRASNPVEQKDLAWFDLSHYDYVRHLSLRQLMTELIVRGSLCSAPDIVTWDGAVLGPGEIFRPVILKSLRVTPNYTRCLSLMSIYRD